MNDNTARFTVWTGGIEANSHYLTQAQAEALAAEYTAQGFDDVQIEEITTSQPDGLTPIYAILFDRHGIEQARITIGDADSLEPEDYAPQFAAMLGIDELEASSHAAQIPDGGEDYRIEITEDPTAPRVWKACNFMAIFN